MSQRVLSAVFVVSIPSQALKARLLNLLKKTIRRLIGGFVNSALYFSVFSVSELPSSDEKYADIPRNAAAKRNVVEKPKK